MPLHLPPLQRPGMCAVYNVEHLRFSVGLFLGLVGEADSTPIVFTPTSWRGFHMTIGFVYFYKVIFQHLGLLVKTWGLCSILKGYSFRYYLYNIFLLAVPKLSADFLSLEISSRAAEFFRPPDVLGGLRSCCWVDPLLRSHMEGLFGLFLVPKGSLFSQGSKIIGGTAPHLRAMSW